MHARFLIFLVPTSPQEASHIMTEHVNSLTFSSDGASLFAACNNMAAMWDASSGGLLFSDVFESQEALACRWEEVAAEEDEAPDQDEDEDEDEDMALPAAVACPQRQTAFVFLSPRDGDPSGVYACLPGKRDILFRYKTPCLREQMMAKCAAFSTNGRLLVASMMEQFMDYDPDIPATTINVWNVHGARSTRSAPLIYCLNIDAASFSLDPSCQFMAVVGGEGQLHVINLFAKATHGIATGASALKALKAHAHRRPKSMAALECEYVLKPKPSARSVSWSPDGQAMVCVNSGDARLLLRRTADGGVMRSIDLSAHLPSACDALLSPDGLKLLVSGEKGEGLIILDTPPLTAASASASSAATNLVAPQQRAQASPNNYTVLDVKNPLCARWAPVGNLLVVASPSTVTVWMDERLPMEPRIDLLVRVKETPLRTFTCPGLVDAVSTADGVAVVIATGDAVTTWRVSDGALLETVATAPWRPRALHAESSRVFLTSNNGHSGEVRDQRGRLLVCPVFDGISDSAMGPHMELRYAAFSADGLKLLVIFSASLEDDDEESSVVCVYDLADAHPERYATCVCLFNCWGLASASLSPNGRSLALGDGSEQNVAAALFVVDISTPWLEPVAFHSASSTSKCKSERFRHVADCVDGFCWSPDGHALFTSHACAHEGAVMRRDVASGAVLDRRTMSLTANDSRIHGQPALTCSPDGRSVLCMSESAHIVRF